MGFLESIDKSILKISFLISVLDGNITDEERSVFMKIAKSFEGFNAGDGETNRFLVKVSAQADELLSLKKIYSAEEFIKAFITEVKGDCNNIRDNQVATRKAFAMWIGMALTGSDYSGIGQKAIIALQAEFNDTSSASLTNYKSVHDVIGAVIGGSFASLATTPWSPNNRKRAKDSSGKPVISDSFLVEIEDCCRTLVTIKIQQEQTSDTERKQELKTSYDSIVASMHAIIETDNNNN